MSDEDYPNAQLDIERLTARAIAQEKYITLADKHIALLERIHRERGQTVRDYQTHMAMASKAQNAEPGTPYGDAIGIIR